MEGIVSKMRYNYGKKEYLVTDGSIEQAVRTDEPLSQGECIRIEGELDAGGSLMAGKIERLAGEKENAVLEKLKVRAGTRITASGPVLVDDELTRKLWPQLKDMAIELTLAKKLGRGILLRFHGDADGVCGAFAITAVAYCRAFQQNSAMYNVKDAFRDISTIGQENKPIIILLDFGSSESCKEALELVSAAGIECWIVDHHPYESDKNNPGKNQKTKFINPFAFADSVSKYTAGYLGCEIAVACGLEAGKARELAKIACSGDKSDILQSDESDGKKAMVLDFLTNHVSFGNNLDFYKKVMDKEELFSSIAQQADESIEEAAKKALGKAKKTEENGVEVCSFALDDIVVKGEWPSSSKITTRVFDKLRTSRPGIPIMCIGHTEYSIVMRLNDEAVAKGLNTNELAEGVKKTMADFVKGGGGHAKAGAISVRPGFSKDVLGELMREISKTLAA